jgi:hypothetical protein
MLRNPLEVAQGAKDPFWVLLWSCTKMCNKSLLYYYFVGVHMIVVFRNFGVALFCTEGGKKCHQAKSLWNMNCVNCLKIRIFWALSWIFISKFYMFYRQCFPCVDSYCWKKGTKVYINSKTPKKSWAWHSCGEKRNSWVVRVQVVTKGGGSARIYRWKRLGMEPNVGTKLSVKWGLGRGEKFTDIFDV